MGRGLKENKLKAPYKDRKEEVESKPKWFRKPFNYHQPNESLFYKKMMAKVKKHCQTEVQVEIASEFQA